MKVKQALDLVTDATDATPSGRGARARESLLREATRIFALKGYAKASTREICQAAGLNVASIHYYFEDKPGLYRAVLLQPLVDVGAQLTQLDDPALPLEQALHQLMGAIIGPLAGDDEESAWQTRLHLREMLEPSVGYNDLVAQYVSPFHEALVGLLARHVGARRPDVALHQLAFALVAMANDYCMSRDYMNYLCPELLGRPNAVAQVLERLVGFGCAMVEHEARRRAAAKASRTTRSPTGTKKR